MHEIGVLTKAVNIVEQTARENGVERVSFITLEVGELTGYLPVFFEKYFPIVTEDRPMFDGTKLQIQVIKGQALCRECGALYNVMRHEGKCPRCTSRNKEILGGQEFLIKEFGC